FLAAAWQFKSRRRLRDARNAYDKALALCNKHVKLSSAAEARIHGELGEVSLTLRDDQRAFKHFTKATGLDPSAWTHWSSLARSHERLGEWRKAAEAFDKAIKLNPK